MRFQPLAAALLLATAICLAIPPARGAAPPQPEQQNVSNIVFIHTHGQPVDSDKVVPVLKALLQAGFSVRKPDTDGDLVGGPGVDYFSEDDQPAAEEIADVVNKARPDDAPKLKPRRETSKHPPHYFGVWL
jgi:hypothetical protein